MTDAPQSTVATKKKRSLVLPIAAVIIAVAAIGFVASRAGLDKALVKQQLDGFIAQVKERAAAQGRDITITYGELEVVGSFASKHVVVHDPVLTMKPLERRPRANGVKKEIDALVVTTPTLAIYPQSADLSSLKIEAADPINLADEDEPTKSLLKVTNNVPLTVTISRKTINKVAYNEVIYQSPSEMDFSYLREQQAQGEEEKTPNVVPVYDTIQLSVAQGSGIKSAVALDDSGLGNATVDFRNIVITPNKMPEGAVKIAEFTSNWTNTLNEKQLNVVTASIKFGPVTSDNPTVPYLPIAFDMDATYEGAMPKTPEAMASVKTQESTMKLKNFNLTVKDASLKATADFNASAADTLPVGTANITLVNAPLVLGELHKYAILNEKNDAAVAALVQQITGTPLAQLKDIVIPIERARGGAFKIGQTTFEELFATFLGIALQQQPGSPAPTVIVPEDGAGAIPQAPLTPQLPAPDKPKSTPIEVPDHGVRG